MDISYIFTHDPLWAVTHTACANIKSDTAGAPLLWNVVFGYS